MHDNPFTIRGMILQELWKSNDSSYPQRENAIDHSSSHDWESVWVIPNKGMPNRGIRYIIFFENSEPQSGIVYHWVKNLRESPKLTQEQTEALFQVAFQDWSTKNN